MSIMSISASDNVPILIEQMGGRIDICEAEFLLMIVALVILAKTNDDGRKQALLHMSEQLLIALSDHRNTDTSTLIEAFLKAEKIVEAMYSEFISTQYHPKSTTAH